MTRNPNSTFLLKLIRNLIITKNNKIKILLVETTPKTEN